MSLELLRKKDVQTELTRLGNIPKMEQSLKKIIHGVEGLTGIDVYSLEWDHVCLRLDSVAQVDILLNRLLGTGSTILSSAMIAGRTIYIIDLGFEISVLGKKISLLELPYPKTGHAYPPSFDHVEVILPINEIRAQLRSSRNFTDYILELDEQGIFTKHQVDIGVDNFGLTGTVHNPEVDPNSTQLPNPSIEIGLKNMEGSLKNYTTIRFHQSSIEDVVKG
jgi:predicted metalloenzyme YecM